MLQLEGKKPRVKIFRDQAAWCPYCQPLGFHQVCGWRSARFLGDVSLNAPKMVFEVGSYDKGFEDYMCVTKVHLASCMQIPLFYWDLLLLPVKLRCFSVEESRKVWLLLEEKQVDYETEKVPMRSYGTSTYLERWPVKVMNFAHKYSWTTQDRFRQLVVSLNMAYMLNKTIKQLIIMDGYFFDLDTQ